MFLPRNSGFTLIEILIVVAVIAVLSAVALPVYNDFMVRARVAESVVFARAHLDRVVEHRVAQNEWPTVAQAPIALGGGSANIASAAYTPGATAQAAASIQVLMGIKIGGNAAGKILSLTVTPASLGSANVGTFTFVCSSVAGTTIPDRYLPSQCRS